MDLGINGKIAVVAAASQGLGKACAQALAKEGARVAILSRRQEELDKVAAEIGAALPVACNLAVGAEIEAAIQKVKEKLGPVSILVNNCGGPPAGTQVRGELGHLLPDVLGCGGGRRQASCGDQHADDVSGMARARDDGHRLADPPGRRARHGMV